MIQIQNLTKKFFVKRALDNFTFTFENKVYGLLGANGAGKTTLMRCINGLYSTKKGAIIFKNKNVMIGYLPQKFGMFKDLTVYEMLQYFCNLKNIKDSDNEIKKAVEIVNLSDRIQTKVRSLSGGMIRRLGIAQAILGNPDVIIFDEPTAGLDPEERLRFKSIVSKIKENKTIIISTHIVEDVEAVCDNIVILNKGKIKACGTCKEITQIAENKVFELNEKEMQEYQDKCIVEKQFEREGKLLFRVLSKEKLNDGVVPTIEDGYISAVRELS